MTRLVKCYNLRFTTGVKIIFEEITGIRSQVLSIFIENNEVVRKYCSLFPHHTNLKILIETGFRSVL
jgi:hypothetical protein